MGDGVDVSRADEAASENPEYISKTVYPMT